MEITRVEKTGVTKITESIRLKYAIVSLGGNVDQVSAMIYNDENIAGYFNSGKSGIVGFSLQENNGLTPEEVKEVFNRAIDDVQLLQNESDAQLPEA
jgi:hypothetical protein